MIVDSIAHTHTSFIIMSNKGRLPALGLRFDSIAYINLTDGLREFLGQNLHAPCTWYLLLLLLEEK